MNIDDLANNYIKLAEDTFGKMCSKWSYVGVEFNDQGPHLRYFPESSEVKISISEKARNDEIQMHFQIAHEVCHLLYPTLDISGASEPPTVFNEGVSTYFSVVVLDTIGQSETAINSLKEHSYNYYEALLLVCDLLNIDEDAVKKLRAIQPMLNQVTIKDFESAKIPASSELIFKLLDVFQ